MKHNGPKERLMVNGIRFCFYHSVRCRPKTVDGGRNVIWVCQLTIRPQIIAIHVELAKSSE